MKTSRASLLAFAIVLLSAGAPSRLGAQTPKAGASCIAIAMPIVEGVPGSAEEAAAGVRDLLTKYLEAPSLRVVVLEARLPSRAGDEAKEKGCEPVLFTTVTRKAGGGGFGKALGQAAGASAWYLPGGGSVAGAVGRAAAAAGLQTASNIASSTKAKDEMRLEYKLQSSAGKLQFGPRTEKQTAQADGEDLLTPIVMRAAEAISTRK